MQSSEAVISLPTLPFCCMAAVQSLHSNQGKVSRKDAKSAWLQAGFPGIGSKTPPKGAPWSPRGALGICLVFIA